MARLSDMTEAAAEGLRNLPLPEFESTPWAQPPPLREARVAIVSTAGVHRRDDPSFEGHATEYRIIPDDVDAADIVMSHISVNFDRSGFAQDLNLVLPLDRLHELAEAGEIGSVARYHYSLMGAVSPELMEDSIAEVIKMLQGDQVTAVLLVPV